MTVKTTRKEKFEGKTNDGYTLIELTTNMSLLVGDAGRSLKSSFIRRWKERQQSATARGASVDRLNGVMK